jgi:hypothetical protein
MDRVSGSRGSVVGDGMLFEAGSLRALAGDASCLVGFSVAISSLVPLFKTVMLDPSWTKGPARLHRTCGVVYLGTLLLGSARLDLFAGVVANCCERPGPPPFRDGRRCIEPLPEPESAGKSLRLFISRGAE